MKDTRIQWHPGFVAAIGSELKEYRELANSILEVCLSADSSLVEKLKGMVKWVEY